MSSSLEERVAALEATVANLNYHIAIRQAIASYGPTVDTTDTTERALKLAELWTADGVYDIGGFKRHQGRVDIASAFEGMHFEMVHDGCCHFMGLPIVQVDGDKATAISYSCVFAADGDKFYPWRVSSNLWQVVRVEGRWQIETRINRLMRGEQTTLDMLGEIDTIKDKALPK